MPVDRLRNWFIAAKVLNTAARSTLARSFARASFSSSRQLPGEVCKEFAIRDRGLAILFPAARWLSPLGSRWLSQTRELVELRVDIHEWIFVIMRADQKDRGNVVRGKCNHYPKRPGKMRDADLRQKIVTLKAGSSAMRNRVRARCGGTGHTIADPSCAVGQPAVRLVPL